MQVCQQQVMGAHQITDLQHDRLELLIILGNRGPLLQVKWMGLVMQGMVQIMELGLQSMAKVLPSTYAQLGPVFVSYRPPPC